MDSRKVVVTGAGGFIGSNLVDDQIGRGNGVAALDLNLDRLEHLADDPRCQLLSGDLRDADLLVRACAGADTVFHLASAHLEVSKGEDFFWEVNVEAVKRFLRIAEENGVRRFVHCSSVGVFGPLESLPADENTECHPDILYETTKLEGENAVREYRGTGSMTSVIIRPAWVYGPRCPRTLKLFRTISKRRFLKVGECQNFRHPLYITDMLAAFELAAHAEGIDRDTFIIAAAEPVRLIELVEKIIDIQGMDYRPVSVPYGLMNLACLGIESLAKLVGREPPFSTRSLKFFTESSAFKIDKARKKLKFSPEVSLAEGLAKTYEYYRANSLLT